MSTKPTINYGLAALASLGATLGVVLCLGLMVLASKMFGLVGASIAGAIILFGGLFVMAVASMHEAAEEAKPRPE